MYSTLNFSKHVNAYNFIWWFFIDGIFFFLFKDENKNREQACLCSQSGLRTKLQVSFCLFGSAFPWLVISTQNHLSELSRKPYQSLGNRFHLDSLPRWNAVSQETMCAQLLGLFKHKLNVQLKWSQSNGGLETRRLWRSFLTEILWPQQNPSV